MDLDEEGVTVSEPKRKRGLPEQGDAVDSLLQAFATLPQGCLPASPAAQARPTS